MTPPGATYRLQLHKDFPLDAARDLVPYLQQLGIDTLYLSPVWQARSGSRHGYDVTDPAAVNSELGGAAALNRLLDTLQAQQMRVIFDIVPNHMAADPANRWWWDVLQHGAASPFADFFDIDWESGRSRQIVLPFLAHPFARELEAGAIGLAWGEQGLCATYGEHAWPLTPRSWRPLLARALGQLYRAHLARPTLALQVLWHRLSPRSFPPLPAPQARLATLLDQHPRAAQALISVLAATRGVVGQPRSWDRMERLLAVQPWRLADFTTANRESNYRRFFDIAELPAVRVENPRVFTESHAKVLELCRHSAVLGLRIDHIDGLYDPTDYLSQLWSRLAEQRRAPYILVEKILGQGEMLPATWRVSGTTGYEFLNWCMEVLLDPEGLRRLTYFYHVWSGTQSPSRLVLEGKQQVLSQLFESEIERLLRGLGHIAARDRWGHDVTTADLRLALGALTTSLPVYRTYGRDDAMSRDDRSRLETAFGAALASHPALPRDTWTFLRRVFFAADTTELSRPEQRSRRQWLMRWQQLTGPVYAKGFEDTALYRYHRLTCLNEVGGNLFTQGLTPLQFHQHMRQRLEATPSGLNTTSTHDTKRSEDVRARIGILSEIPDAWASAVTRWHHLGLRFQSQVGTLTVPDPATEYLLFQTLVGAWPLEPGDLGDFPDRIRDYLLKAVREAKIHTQWVAPNLGYERALASYVENLLGDPEFLADSAPLIDLVAYFGGLSSLAQILLKIFAPGVPDFYQGSELWNLSLTDPDNRRPVDFSRGSTLLRAMQATPPSPQDLLTHWRDGRIKLFFTQRALDLRRRYADIFAHGAYQGLAIHGSGARHVLGFTRHWGETWFLVVVPRCYARFLGAQPAAPVAPDPQRWASTIVTLPPGAPHTWRDALTGRYIETGTSQQLEVTTILAELPFTVLQS